MPNLSKPDSTSPMDSRTSLPPDRALHHHVEQQTRRVKALEARVAERDRLGRILRDRLVERGLYATWLESEIGQRDDRLGSLMGELADRAAEVERSRAELDALRSSRSWKVVSALSRGVGKARRIVRSAPRLPLRLLRSRRAHNEPRSTPTPERAAPIVPPAPIAAEPATAHSEAAAPGPDRNAILRFIPQRSDPYPIWLRNNAPNREELFEELQRLPLRPTFSVIVLARAADHRSLMATLASLREQIDPDLDLTLVGGPNSEPGILDDRSTFLDDRGDPIGTLREAAERATGDYVIVLEEGTILSPDGLLAFARAACESDELPTLIFADEDRIDPDGHRFGPRFRPGWSPEMLLSTNAIGRTFAVRKSALDAVGGIRSEFGEAWAYDLSLRLVEHSGPIVHVPRVLVSIPGDPEVDPTFDRANPESIHLAALALTEAVDRRGLDARAVHPDWAARRQIPAFSLEFPDEGPKVAILVPTRNRSDLVKRCLDSVVERTTYRNYEIVLIDNGSDDPESLTYFDSLRGPIRMVRIGSEGGVFNYARIHNEAVDFLEPSIAYVVLLNNDTEVRSGDWLSQLVGFGRMPGVGAVGARLLYADGRVQHAGMVADQFDGLPGHVFKGLPWWDPGPQGLARLSRNVGSVTAACMLVARSSFLDLGGFDENRFKVGYNDVDFCRRLNAKGFRCVIAAGAELLHFEGASRGVEDNPSEADSYRDSWSDHPDPHRHPSLSRDDDRMGLSTRRVGPLGAVEGKPIRILFDLPSLDGGASSRFAFDLISGLRDREGFTAAIRSRAEGPMESRFRELGIPVAIDPREPSRSPLERARAPSDQLPRGINADLLLVIGLDGFETVLASQLVGIPTVWTIREAVDFRDAFGSLDDESAAGAIEAFGAPYRVVFPAWSVRRLFHPVETSSNFETVFESTPPINDPANRDDARHQLGITESTVVLTSFIEDEDDSTSPIISQVVDLARSGRAILAQLVGPPEVLQKLGRADTIRAMPDHFRLISVTGDVGCAVLASDALIGTSRRDPSPQTLAFGKLVRCPVILADSQGVDDASRFDRSVWLFDPENPRTLRDLITRVADDPEAGRLLASRSGRGPTFEGMIASYARLCREAVAVRATESGPR